MSINLKVRILRSWLFKFNFVCSVFFVHKINFQLSNMHSILKTLAFYWVLGLPFAQYIGVTSQLYGDEINLSGPNVCKRIEEYVLHKHYNHRVVYFKAQAPQMIFFRMGNWFQFVILSVVHQCNDRFPVEVVVTEKQPYQERTSTWCLAVPPRCSTYKIRFRTVNKTQILMKERVVFECCGKMTRPDDWQTATWNQFMIVKFAISNGKNNLYCELALCCIWLIFIWWLNSFNLILWIFILVSISILMPSKLAVRAYRRGLCKG